MFVLELPEGVEDLIKDEPLIASFATSVDGQPHVAPVWYRYEDGKVLISTSGKKAKNARKNPKVAVSIEKNESGISQGMVTFQGTASVIEDPGIVKQVSKKIYSKYLGENVEEWNDFFQKQIEAPAPDSVIIEVDIESAATQD